MRLYTLLMALFAALTSVNAADTETRVKDLFTQASDLMAAGELQEAQLKFDTAFAIPGVRNTGTYPFLINEQATLQTWRGERKKAITGKRTVIPLLPQAKDTELEVSVYTDLGILYHHYNKTDSSIFFYQKADSAAHVLGDDSWLASVTQNIGVLYYNLKRYTDAERYLIRAKEYSSQSQDTETSVSAHQILSAIQIERGKIDEAGKSIKKAWTEALSSGDRRLKLRCIPSLYRYFDALDMPDSVNKYMAIGEQMLSNEPLNSVLRQGYVMSRARMHYRRGQYHEALQWYLMQAHSPMQTERSSLMQHIAQCYSGLGNYRKAYMYMDSARMWNDSMTRMDVAIKLEEFNHKYQTLEQEMENATLREHVLQRNRMLLWTVIIILFLASLSLILYIRLRLRHQHHAKLLHEKELESSQRYIEGLEDERKYFAKELHDGVSNDLLGLRMKIETGCDDAGALASIVDNTRDTVRRISHNLMPPEFDNLELDNVLSAYIDALSRHKAIRFTYKSSPGHNHIPAPISREVYRVVQEYLMNLIQHSNATQVTVRFESSPDGLITLSITDNSATLPSGAAHTGIGLRTIALRAKALDATTSLTTVEHENTFTFKFHIHK